MGLIWGIRPHGVDLASRCQDSLTPERVRTKTAALYSPGMRSQSSVISRKLLKPCALYAAHEDMPLPQVIALATDSRKPNPGSNPGPTTTSLVREEAFSRFSVPGPGAASPLAVGNHRRLSQRGSIACHCPLHPAKTAGIAVTKGNPKAIADAAIQISLSPICSPDRRNSREMRDAPQAMRSSISITVKRWSADSTSVVVALPS